MRCGEMLRRRCDVFFRDVQHQEAAVNLLRRGMRAGRTHHAYLFEGPDGVGKELTARALAAALMCLDTARAADADACGVCSSCRLLAADNNPDFHLVERGLHRHHPERSVRTSKGLYLVVDLIRHFLIEPAALTPTQGARRVFIVRDAERMNEDAQNALLKTLEEPPGSVCLVLVTSSVERLLPTIRSRCQRIGFGFLPAAFVAERLKAAGLSTDEAQALATLSGGRLGVALRWRGWGVLDELDPVATLFDRSALGKEFRGQVSGAAERIAKRAWTLFKKEAAERHRDPDSPPPGADQRDVPTDLLRDAYKLVFLLIATLHRDALVRREGAAIPAALPQAAPVVVALAQRMTVDELENAARAVSEAEHMLDRNVKPELVCDWLDAALQGVTPAN